MVCGSNLPYGMISTVHTQQSTVTIQYRTVPYRTGTVPYVNRTVLYRYGTVIIIQYSTTARSNLFRLKLAGDVFCSVLCGPNGHKDYWFGARASSSLILQVHAENWPFSSIVCLEEVVKEFERVVVPRGSQLRVVFASS